MDAQQVTLSSAVKQAEGESTPLSIPRRTQLKQDAANYIANLAAASVAAGGMGAGIQGLLGMFQRRQLPSRKRPFAGTPLPISPIDEEEKLAAYPTLSKLAEGPAPDWSSGEWQSQGRNFLGNTLGKALYNLTMKTDPNNPSWLAGDMAKHISGVPATLGIGLPLALGGFYGGYKGVGSIINDRRKAEQEGELEEAKRRYAELAGLAPSTTRHLKSSSAPTDPADVFDELADDMLTKLAEPQAQEAPGLGRTVRHGATATGLADAGSTALGALLGYSLLSGLGSGYLGYQWGKGHSQTKLIEDAMKQRQKDRALHTGGQLPIQFYLPEEKDKRVAA